MICERCQTREATLQIERTVGSTTEQKNRCYACAEEVGIKASTSPFTGFPGFSEFFEDPFLSRGRHEHAAPLGGQPSAGEPSRRNREQVNILDAFSDRA